MLVSIAVGTIVYMLYRTKIYNITPESKNDFGPAKPVGRSQTWPVEAFCPYLLSSKEDT